MDDIIAELNFIAPQAEPSTWLIGPKTEINVARVEPSLPAVAAVYTPRQVITPPPVLQPRQQPQQSPAYDLRQKRRVRPALLPQTEGTEPSKVDPPETIDQTPQPQSDPTKPLPREPRTVAGNNEPATKTILDLFV